MKLKLSLFLLFFFGITWVSVAQNISNFGEDQLKSVKVDTLSRQSLIKIYNGAKSRGLSIDQVINLAIQRGMPASQARKLRIRLNRVQSSTNKGMGNDFDINRMRIPVSDTIGPDSFGSELQIRDHAGEDSVLLAK